MRIDSIKKLAFEEVKINTIPIWYDKFLENKSAFYRRYLIPKSELKKKLDNGYQLPYPRNRVPKNQLKNWREIRAPVDILKDEQKKIRDILYGRRPSKIDHCVRGKNRYTAMREHAGKPIIIGLDIKDAFPSTSKDMIQDALFDEGFDQELVSYISEISTIDNCLPQGSPCSPVLLNLVRKPLDYRLLKYTNRLFGNDSKVTVYVDNYFISSKSENMNKFIPRFKAIADEAGFKLNDKKIHIMRKGSRLGGLGLVVNKSENGKVTAQPNKKYRDKIRAILFQAETRLKNGELPQRGFDYQQVSGMIETLKDTVYYDKYKNQLKRIKSGLDNISRKTVVPLRMAQQDIVTRQ